MSRLKRTPFDQPPWTSLMGRLVFPACVWLFVWWVGIGWLDPQNETHFQFNPSAWFNLNDEVITGLTQPPGICTSSTPLRDVEVALCQEFQTTLFQKGILAAIPWVGCFGVIYFTFLAMSLVYSRAAKLVRNGRPVSEGVIVSKVDKNDPLPLVSFFEAFFMLKAVRVQLPNRVIIVAYLGQEKERPKKNQPVLLYPLRVGGFSPRYLAILHHPHIATLGEPTRV